MFHSGSNRNFFLLPVLREENMPNTQHVKPVLRLTRYANVCACVTFRTIILSMPPIQFCFYCPLAPLSEPSDSTRSTRKAYTTHWKMLLLSGNLCFLSLLFPLILLLQAVLSTSPASSHLSNAAPMPRSLPFNPWHACPTSVHDQPTEWSLGWDYIQVPGFPAVIPDLIVYRLYSHATAVLRSATEALGPRGHFQNMTLREGPVRLTLHNTAFAERSHTAMNNKEASWALWIGCAMWANGAGEGGKPFKWKLKRHDTPVRPPWFVWATAQGELTYVRRSGGTSGLQAVASVNTTVQEGGENDTE